MDCTVDERICADERGLLKRLFDAWLWINIEAKDTHNDGFGWTQRKHGARKRTRRSLIFEYTLGW